MRGIRDSPWGMANKGALAKGKGERKSGLTVELKHCKEGRVLHVSEKKLKSFLFEKAFPP